MKRMSFIVLAGLWLQGPPALPADIIPLPGLVQPKDVIINNDQLLIAGFPEVCVYSLKDFKLIARFGKDGRGPQEFSSYVKLQYHPQYIVVSSKKKVSFFDRQGNFIKELVPKSPTATVDEFKPLGDRFIVYGEVHEGNTLFNTMEIFDGSLQKTKEIVRWPAVHQLGRGFDPVDIDMKGAEFQVYDGTIFLLFRESGIVRGFDGRGKALFTTDYHFERIPMPAEIRNEFHEFLKTAPGYKDVYESIKHEIKFKDHFQAAQRIVVTGDKIYALTFKKDGDKREFVILDTRGKFIKKVMVPFKNADPRMPFPFTVHDGQLYQLITNSASSGCELHINPIR